MTPLNIIVKICVSFYNSATEIILTLPDLPDWKYLYQSISRKIKVNFNGFPIFPLNWVHIYQSISDTGYTYLNQYSIYLLLRAGKTLIQHKLSNNES